MKQPTQVSKNGSRDGRAGQSRKASGKIPSVKSASGAAAEKVQQLKRIEEIRVTLAAIRADLEPMSKSEDWELSCPACFLMDGHLKTDDMPADWRVNIFSPAACAKRKAESERIPGSENAVRRKEAAERLPTEPDVKQALWRLFQAAYRVRALLWLFDDAFQEFCGATCPNDYGSPLAIGLGECAAAACAGLAAMQTAGFETIDKMDWHQAGMFLAKHEALVFKAARSLELISMQWEKYAGEAGEKYQQDWRRAGDCGLLASDAEREIRAAWQAAWDLTHDVAEERRAA